MKRNTRKCLIGNYPCIFSTNICLILPGRDLTTVQYTTETAPFPADCAIKNRSSSFWIRSKRKQTALSLFIIIGQPPVTLQIAFCQQPPTSALDLFFVFFNSDFFPDFTLGQPGYNDMSHLAISIMLRRVRLIYFKRDNK